MKLRYLTSLMPAIFGLRMADEAPAAAVIVQTGEETPAPDATDIQRAADDTLRTAERLAESMTRTPEETNAIITAIGVLAETVNSLGLSLFARLDEIRADIDGLRDDVDDIADEQTPEEIADAAVVVAEAAAETAQAVPEVAEAQAQAEVAAAEEPAPRANENRRRRYI